VNILDENILDGQRQLLRSWRVPIRHIGYDVGWKGMKDERIIPFLTSLRRVTFFTRDGDFYKRSWCHARYCLVVLSVGQADVAVFVRRLLNHPEFNTEAKRMGTVIRVSVIGLTLWRVHAETESSLAWMD
jgi:hypothetical protein